MRAFKMHLRAPKVSCLAHKLPLLIRQSTAVRFRASAKKSVFGRSTFDSFDDHLDGVPFLNSGWLGRGFCGGVRPNPLIVAALYSACQAALVLTLADENCNILGLTNRKKSSHESRISSL